jgi:uncharacterized secreted protein with C-terminal beta-propeller domain
MRLAIALVLLLTLTACDSERPEPGVVLEPKLTSSGSCGDLEEMIESAAIREMNADIDAIIDEIENGEDGGWDDIGIPSPAAAPTPAPAGGALDYTTTNTQERDVDEPDFVKNDGSRIFVLQGRLLIGLRSWPPESTRIVSETAIEGWPVSMLLDQNRLVVFSGVSVPGLGNAEYPSVWAPSQSNAVKITVLDVSSAVPRVVDEQYLEGSFLAARRNGSSVRLVSVAGKRGPALLYWPEKHVDWSSRSAARAAMEKVREENVRRIRGSVAADWLPRLFTASPGGLREVERECSSFAAADATTRLGFTTISTLDLSGPATDHRTLLARADLAYASSRFLYLAARHEWYRNRTQTKVREDHSYLFQYDLTADGRSVIPTGAGNAPGTILNSFSMDEDGGYLRVATTRRTWLGWRLKATSNGLSVLRASGGHLLQVGELTGLARDEQLYAARFEGQRGYLVTFRNIDPLFTLDLANPQQPRVVGELKVPGYSTYLHMLDPDHLLTVGREADASGRLIGGVQLQIFDVSRLDAPGLRHQYRLGSRSSSSEAEYEHKAFTYFASRALLALPYSDWSRARSYDFVSALELLRVTTATGIAPVGSIDHSDLVRGGNDTRYGFNPQIRRSILADDYVYSISQGGLKVHDTRQLSRTLVTIPFPEPR